MSAADLLSPKARDEVSRLVGEIEASTSAEVVVVVRAISGRYIHTDMLVGCALAFTWICVFLFHPAPFDDDLVPVQVLAAFVLGMMLSLSIAPLRRSLTAQKWRDENVERAACAAFVDRGVFRTRGRTGLLVFISAFERRAMFVGDVGIEGEGLDEAMKKARIEIEAGLGTSEPMTKFVGALRELGKTLAKALPRAEDDINELPNEVTT